MKKFVCALCSLVIVITCITGCGSSGNPFTADDAIKGQVGNLYYTVPGNAELSNASTDGGAMYEIPINNSTEKYTLMIVCRHTDSNEEYEKILQYIDDSIKQIDLEEGIEATTEEIDAFLGKTIDKGCKREGKNNGKKTVIIIAAESGNVYMITYTVKTGFYDQSIWDNFYAQLKLV